MTPVKRWTRQGTRPRGERAQPLVTAGPNASAKAQMGSAAAGAGKGGGTPGAKGNKGKLEELDQEKRDQLGAEIGEQQRKAILAQQDAKPQVPKG